MEHFGHLVGGPAERFEAPGLHALNFLIQDALGGGGMASLRIDPQGQGLWSDGAGDGDRRAASLGRRGVCVTSADGNGATPTGILAGLRVLELGQVLAGPYAGAIFADLGAEVTKVERLDGGDDGRSYGGAVSRRRFAHLPGIQSR